MFGSGQWTIWEGYAATKLMRAGFRSNNLDPNARHCMASAAVRLHAHLRHGRADGLLRRFRAGRRLRALGLEHGGDAPDPVDAGDRPPAQRAARRGRRALDLHASQLPISPTSPIIFKPGTDLAILNYIANHIISTGRVNRDFVATTRPSCGGNADIGYGLRPEHPLEMKATARRRSRPRRRPTDFDAYAEVRDATTRSRRRRSSPASSRACCRLWPSSTPTRSARWCRSGRWVSTSMFAASGPTSSSTTCTC